MTPLLELVRDEFGRSPPMDRAPISPWKEALPSILFIEAEGRGHELFFISGLGKVGITRRTDRESGERPNAPSTRGIFFRERASRLRAGLLFPRRHFRYGTHVRNVFDDQSWGSPYFSRHGSGAGLARSRELNRLFDWVVVARSEKRRPTPLRFVPTAESGVSALSTDRRPLRRPPAPADRSSHLRPGS